MSDGADFPRFVADEQHKRQYPGQHPAEATLDYIAAIFRSHSRSTREQRQVAASAVEDYFDWKAGQKRVDTPTSHLRNALQLSLLLADDVDRMVGNPGYIADAKRGLRAIDARIRAALEILEGGKS